MVLLFLRIFSVYSLCMKNVKMFLLAAMLVFSSYSFAQNVDKERFIKMSKQSDFVHLSQGKWESQFDNYFKANDTLYEYSFSIFENKIALDDIDFETTIVKKVYGIKPDTTYPYSILIISPKKNKGIVNWLNLAQLSDDQIKIKFPDQELAEQALAVLKPKSNAGFSAGNSSNQNSEQLPVPASLCTNTGKFINDLRTNNLKYYLGRFISSGMGFTFYKSAISFPNSLETIIVDTSALQPNYRRAEILMRSETVSNKNVSSNMQALYDHINMVYAKCLGGKNGFETVNRDNDKYSNSKLQTDYTRFLQNNSNGLFSNLQTKSGLIVRVKIKQTSQSTGIYTNKLYIFIEEQ